jgi:hypothetical protein
MYQQKRSVYWFEEEGIQTKSRIATDVDDMCE